MFFNPFDEFPHKIIKLELQTVKDGMGGSTKRWNPNGDFDGFMDTPTTKEQLEAMQMSVTLDRYLYYPFTLELPSNARVRFEKIDYEIVGEGEDQGGMHEKMRVPLKKVK